MIVLLFQFGVFASMCLALHFGNRRSPEAGRQFLQVAAAAWSLETILYVFAPWLILLQLVVIWSTYAFLTRPKPAEPAKAAEPVRPVPRPEEPLGQPSRAARWMFAILLLAGLAIPAVGVALHQDQPTAGGQPVTTAADRSFLLPQPTEADVVDCAMQRSKYFQAIGSYPRLSDGRDAVSVAWERCRASPTAFSPVVSEPSLPSDVAACVDRGTQYFISIGSFPLLSNGRDAALEAVVRCQRTTTAFP